jgi:thioredoxin 1
MALIITDEEMFEKEVLNSDKPVLVDFFATWCGPCKMLSPTVEEISEEYAEKVKVVKLDIDQLTPVALKYGVMSVPTLILFENGQVVTQSVGARPKSDIVEMLQL